MPVLPYHKYIGPGNETNSGEPVDEDDRIARLHDIKYDEAKSHEDIRQADIEAIQEFRRSWRQGNWHSLIGDVGLSIKYFIETYTGVLYPKILDIQLNLNELELQTETEFNLIKKFLIRQYILKENPQYLTKYLTNLLLPWERKNVNNYNFTKKPEMLMPIFYVPLNWTDLYLKYGIPLILNNCTYCARQNATKNENIVVKKSITTLKKDPQTNNKIRSDFFNLNFWLNFKFNNIKTNETYHTETTKNGYFIDELFEQDLFKIDM